MVKLVFVAGVAGRDPKLMLNAARNRDILLRKVLFERDKTRVQAPNWHGEMPASALAGLPALGPPSTFSPAAERETRLAELASEDATAALDAMLATVVDLADQQGELLKGVPLDTFLIARNLMMARGARPKIAAADDDAGFVRHLAEALDPGSKATVSVLEAAARVLADRARGSVSGRMATVFKDQVNPMVARVFAVTLSYFTNPAVRAAIQRKVATGIDEALRADAKQHRHLILIGHCVGGVILHDMLCRPEASGLPPDLKVGALITVGSQVGLAQALGLCGPNDAAGPPAEVRTWLDVLDPSDVLGVAANADVQSFAGPGGTPKPIRFEGLTGLLPSHTSYFKRPQFYAQVRSKLQEAKLLEH